MNDSLSYSLVRSFGGGLYNRDLTEVTITRDETVEAIQFSADVRAVHRVAPASNELRPRRATPSAMASVR